MLYRVIGLMSGSSLDGLDIAFVHLQESSGSWKYEIIRAECYKYDPEWKSKLRKATSLNARDYQLLHTAYGHYTGELVNKFMERHNLQHNVHLVASHGHTTFHIPDQQMTAQLGDGASIAAETGLPVVSDLRALDIALQGQGAPIVPIGEKLLFNDFDLFLNVGGIANLSAAVNDTYIAFDVCAANRVLNMLAEEKGFEQDEDGRLASNGNIDPLLLEQLNGVDYYGKAYPKSLSNTFGTDIIYPMIKSRNLSVEDSLRTYVEHIVYQVSNAFEKLQLTGNRQLLVSGGGSFNIFLMERLKNELSKKSIEVCIPSKEVIQYKEALIVALIGTLRWREEYNVLSSVTGAGRNSIGGALWLGTEA